MCGNLQKIVQKSGAKRGNIEILRVDSRFFFFFLVGVPAALKSSFLWNDGTVVLVMLTHAAAYVFAGI